MWEIDLSASDISVSTIQHKVISHFFISSFQKQCLFYFVVSFPLCNGLSPFLSVCVIDD